MKFKISHFKFPAETLFTTGVIGVTVAVIGLYIFLSRENYRAIREQELNGARDFQDVSRKLSFQATLGGSNYIGPIYLSLGSIPTTEISVPTLSIGNTIRGVIIAELDLRKFLDIVLSVASEYQTVPYIVDGTGTLVAHPDFQYVLSGTNLSDRNIVASVIRSAEVEPLPILFAGYTNKDGVASFSAGKPLAFGWGAVVEKPLTVFFGASTSTLRLNVTIGTITIILLSLLFWRLYYALSIERKKLASANMQLDQYLKENLISANLLVQRDRELTMTKRELINRSVELNEIAKVLVRRDIELTEVNERLQELDRVKSDFVTIAAHQLRTPLTGVKWAIYTLLETGVLSSKQRQYAQNAFRATQRVIALVNDLLDIARLEEGRTVYIFQRQSILPLLYKSLEGIKKWAEEKGVALAEIFPPATQVPPADIDEEKFLVVFDNLLGNAVKYTAPGGKITVRLEVSARDPQIKVEDTGIGIPQHQLDLVFTKFFRGDNAVLYQTSGTGLGLYLSKTIVERHNGTISVKSVEDKGSTVTVTIPYVK